jgi:hypothetical protein
MRTMFFVALRNSKGFEYEYTQSNRFIVIILAKSSGSKYIVMRTMFFVDLSNSKVSEYEYTQSNRFIFIILAKTETRLIL